MPEQDNTDKELILLTERIDETPDPSKALDDPEGLSAVGGDLSPERLIHLYSKGFFPWYSDPDPILWWHPKERCVLQPQHFHESRSLRKASKKENWSFTLNQEFQSVMSHCAALREKEGTWISDDIKQAYQSLHALGYAHSIEARIDGELVGGFYGVAMGKVFFGESMFSLCPNASKLALNQFCKFAQEYEIELIDCQVESDHLLSLGAQLMPRDDFSAALARLITTPNKNQFLTNLEAFG
ncbi:leucyl/phenylalanyl-tRNA--protein transferase [Marinomonas pollencensis]|uniref:Leucyl/phenylalanyl-tRNA--protein transferase n=1 Tax=Marinomonas pollencensis TaxID=491954 RepID=A0A3E0DTP3_9GAMM|nr:leucyl/phenylalanyl-tRNA--protein transferase [Marinomonas pollencensis]REG86756.1 leucyl/phenylalanyl-tRNA--protein transferase [Marinomonas pollencensis]